MSYVPKILVFAGSARGESLNKKLALAAVKELKDVGTEVTYVDLKDYPLPLFDVDLETKEGLPPNARKLKDLFLSHQGLFLACPEYNSGITPLLKNTIDWVSRPALNEAELAGFANKVAALTSASPGRLGGLRGLVIVRLILSNIGVLVLPTQLAIPGAREAFTEEGSLKDSKQQSALEKLAAELFRVVHKLNG